jgi:hypothetical protein
VPERTSETSYINNWLTSKQLRQITDLLRVAGIQCCYWAWNIDISLSH